MHMTLAQMSLSRTEAHLDSKAYRIAEVQGGSQERHKMSAFVANYYNAQSEIKN